MKVVCQCGNKFSLNLCRCYQCYESMVIPLEKLKFSKRARSFFFRHTYKNLGDLCSMDENTLLSKKGLGVKTLNEIKEVLKNHNLTLIDPIN